MAAYAYHYVPYYRETMDRLGLTPADLVSAQDLARLPILERDRLQRDPLYYTSTEQPLERYLALRGGGSTGTHCTIYHDVRALCQYAAHAARSRAVVHRLLGRSLVYRKTHVASPAGSSFTTLKFYEENALVPPWLGMSQQKLSVLDPPETNARLLNDFRPDVVVGFGSYLAMLFAHLRSTGNPFHHPKALCYTSDQVPNAMRRVIEGELNIPVFSLYDAVEASNIGFECEQHTGLHLNMDLCPVRIVDGAGMTLPEGASGEVIVSNLINRATVLLNYRLGDIATLLPKACPCGRSLPLLSQVEGRSEDWIELASGRLVHPDAVNGVFRSEGHVWQHQVVQEAPARFRINLVVSGLCDYESTSQRIVAAFTSALGAGVEVEVRRVEDLERTAMGKVRPVVSLRGRQRMDQTCAGTGGT
jgi:phenylacetate-CoA ligase